MVVDLEALDRVILALDRLGYGSYADEVRAHRERTEREIDRLRADVEYQKVGIDGLEITVRQMARELEEARDEVERLRMPRPAAIVSDLIERARRRAKAEWVERVLREAIGGTPA